MTDANLISPAVLLVEDDPLLRLDLAGVLRRRGFRVIEAADAAKALELIRTLGSSIAWLITDYHLGGISGVHVAFEYRFQNPLRPIIFITGRELPEDVRRMSGVVYLRKPFTHDALADAMGSLSAGPSCTVKSEPLSPPQRQ
jgi:DNA-binding response OmpR family regulator